MEKNKNNMNIGKKICECSPQLSCKIVQIGSTLPIPSQLKHGDMGHSKQMEKYID